MEYLQLTMDDYIQSKNEIKENIGGIVKSFVKVGWLLTRIDRSEAYKLDGYRTIAEFAKAEYDMTPSGVSRFMDVYERYSVEGDTPELKEQFRDFKFAQLTEMLQLTDEEQTMFRPETKRETIRDFKAFNKENDADPERLLNWNQEPEDMMGKLIVQMFRENREKMNALFGSRAWEEWNVKDMTEILNPSGNSHFRFKTLFIVFYDHSSGLMWTEFGHSPEKMSWDDFLRRIKEIFGEGAGSRTWEECFGEPEEEQIPGQDNIMNHPELMPDDQENAQNTPESAQNTPGNAQNGTKSAENAAETAAQSTENAAETQRQEPKAHEPVPEEIGPERLVAPAQKKPMTEEQKYDADQRRIDRETKKKLQEMEDEEKMEHLPSDAGQQVHVIRMASSNWDDIALGNKAFEIRRKDKDYWPGHMLQMMEFTDGAHTGRRIDAEITYVLDDHSGLVDGFCILGFKVMKIEG